MLKTALGPLQTAIFDRLSSDTPLNEVITGVFDSVKKGTLYPYVTIGEPTTNSFETKSSFGEEIAVVLHCWSRYEGGKKEAYDILNLMLQSITQSPMHLEGGFSIFKVKFQQLTVINDLDNDTKHGIMRIRFHINN
jgi:hypothetical protein